jgi:hypothetical protein
MRAALLVAGTSELLGNVAQAECIVAIHDVRR